MIPFTIQTPLSKRIDIRLTTIENYHFGGETGYSDIGFQLIAHVFIQKKETNSKSGGVYIGTLYGIGRNLLNDHYTHTIGIELGYMFQLINNSHWL